MSRKPGYYGGHQGTRIGVYYTAFVLALMLIWGGYKFLYWAFDCSDEEGCTINHSQ